jgi:hypothetical protein
MDWQWFDAGGPAFLAGPATLPAPPPGPVKKTLFLLPEEATTAGFPGNRHLHAADPASIADGTPNKVNGCSYSADESGGVGRSNAQEDTLRQCLIHRFSAEA